MNDLNRRVHEALGNSVQCDGRVTYIDEEGGRCGTCDQTVGLDANGAYLNHDFVPDYSGDARLFVPLLIELIGHGFQFYKTGMGEYAVSEMRRDDLFHNVTHTKDPLVCICEAWLKWRAK